MQRVLETETVLALLETPGLGRASVRSILPLIQGPGEAEVLDAWKAAKERGLVRKGAEREALKTGFLRARAVVEEALKGEMTVLTWHDPRFPVRLKTIPDAPLVLFARGDARRLKADFALAIVGTREPSDAGKRFAREAGRCAAESGVTVVSGLAKGCDAAAHWGCLEASGPTVAFLAHGVDQVYPRENQDLADAILAANGCLASEYAPGIGPQSHHFVERDRLQSGLADWVLVVETDVVGGTMKTVGFATEQGRRLLAFAHPPGAARDAPKAQGNALLLRERGAGAVADAQGLSRLLWGLVPAPRARKAVPQAPPAAPPAPEIPPVLPADRREPKKKKAKAASKPKALPTTNKIEAFDEETLADRGLRS